MCDFQILLLSSLKVVLGTYMNSSMSLYSGWWEFELFPAWVSSEFAWFAAPKKVFFSCYFSLLAFPLHISRLTFKDSESLRRFLEVFLCIMPSSPVLCVAKSRCLSLHGLPEYRHFLCLGSPSWWFSSETALWLNSYLIFPFLLAIIVLGCLLSNVCKHIFLIYLLYLEVFFL